ncbi:MAG: hypothetical protein ACRDRS_26955 [Pseudonocardiaceae bacterium]
MSLVNGRLAARGLIDPARVRVVLRRAAAGLSTPWGSVVSLLAVEVWLRTIDTTAPIEWSHAPREPVSS